jgi:hypothetical protein
MYAHIVPCRSLMRITIPCSAYIGVMPRENYKNIFIMQKTKIMQILKKFSDREWKEYEKLVDSPFSIRDAVIIKNS